MNVWIKDIKVLGFWYLQFLEFRAALANWEPGRKRIELESSDFGFKNFPKAVSFKFPGLK